MSHAKRGYCCCPSHQLPLPALFQVPTPQLTSQPPQSSDSGMGWWSTGSSGSKTDPEKNDSADDPPSRWSLDKQQEEGKQQREQKPSIFSPLSTPTTPTTTRASSSESAKDWNASLNAFDWAQFKEPKNLVPTVLLTSGILFVVYVQRKYLRRFPEATDITPAYLRSRSLLGRVTSVGDGDNFRIYHTPGGRLVGWGWLPLMRVPTARKELKDQTVRAFTSFFEHFIRYFYDWKRRVNLTDRRRFISALQASMRRNWLISVVLLNPILMKHTCG